ncbi:Adenylate kinase 7 [Trichoplax sp. H2]|nr:Adenylate kinase 7 [Trichoplax sp. H2]|eukprot:RDD36619.1 Adenylate kinase 7 [Trichoplax sp. H2]
MAVRVFIDSVDSYAGKVVSKLISNSVPGATLADIDDASEGSQADYNRNESKENTYEVIGTLKVEGAKKPNWVKEIVSESKQEDLFSALKSCDIIVYNISEDPSLVDQASWAVSALHAEIESFTRMKTFICISNAMTWARTRPIDLDDPEVPFTEDDYRRRKPHQNYKAEISLEKLVVKLGKTNKELFSTFIIMSGMLYGCGESLFHYLFKAAWLNHPYLQCYGNGQNVIPTIHVKDLASIILNVMDGNPRVKYIIAVDDSQSTLEEIVRAVSINLGSGKVKNVTKEEAISDKNIEKADFDKLLVSLRMESTTAKDLNVEWVAETGLVDNIEGVIREYKEERKLFPLRMFVFGPPAVGKSTIVEQLCKHYKLHHIKMTEVIQDAISELERSAARADIENEDEEDDQRAQEDQELLEALQENREQNNGRYDDQFVVRFFRQKLKSMPCQNQGFIIDGYPKLYSQAQELFASEEDEDDTEENLPEYDASIMPEFIISLDASDDFLKNRVINLPEKEVHGSHNTEEGLIRRLARYRAENTEDETVLNYFDELEIHPEHFDVTDDDSPKALNTVKAIIKLIGEPRNYGPTAEELEEIKRREEEEKELREAQEKIEREEKEAREAEERAIRQTEWKQRLDEVRKQEKELIDTRSIPLRNYLMKHVMPTLSEGLIECCKSRPDDPVDFLAEYLLQNNPVID